jgi:serine/threonine-protein kinase HipA
LFRAATVIEGLPPAFSDSTPDWWGRQLVTRDLRLAAAAAGQPTPLLTDPDFLVGVGDQTRQGNLRFATPGTTQFVDAGSEVPKLVGLPDLLEAADRVADDDDTGVAAALKTLLDASSGAIGGARPKASVQENGHLLIAKFPYREDAWDVMAWEKTALDLAERCGIEVPDSRLVNVRARHVLLLRRFDRDDAGDRVGYVSARTLSQARSSGGNDYLALVDAIEDHSGNTANDLRDLWSRIAFTVATNNTDDHFHNHGFCRSPQGWTLSPAFDINIDPQLAKPRSTALGRSQHSRRFAADPDRPIWLLRPRRKGGA